MPRIRVMIVEDSGVIRQFLEHIIGSDPRLEVVASVESGEDALRALTRVSPDVISMDIHLPGMSGLEATRRIMEERPTPIVVVSGSLQPNELEGSMLALKAGALVVVGKPVGTTHEDYESLAERLCTQLAIMSQVKVVRQRFNGRKRPRRAARDRRDVPFATAEGRDHRSFVMIGIVASTGGPRALQTLLGAIPAEFPVPIALVQHITAGFHYGFVDWLDGACPLSVVTAEDGQFATAGHVYVAPPDEHLTIHDERLCLWRGDPVSAQRPSGTVLLESMAASLGEQALGVVLTGMGDDGALGLSAIRHAGGYTIAEDESTAVVYGMPAVAKRLGAVCEQLPLDDIARRLQSLVRETVEVG
jgi:two-component system chemotaxis response regulator CheB